MIEAPKNAQEAYERQRAHFSKPGAVLAKREADGYEGWSCEYRLYGDAKQPGCAIGCLIPDELYDPKFDSLEDGTSFDSLMSDNDSRCRPVQEYFFDFLPVDLDEDCTQSRLWDWYEQSQSCHDDSTILTAAQLVERLDDLAREFGLKVVGK